MMRRCQAEKDSSLAIVFRTMQELRNVLCDHDSGALLSFEWNNEGETSWKRHRYHEEGS
jgi:hypothetical protein